MKQLGNLAVICAQRPELLLQLRDGLVSVQAKNRAAMEAVWNDDARIEKMIYELNFGAAENTGIDRPAEPLPV